jgi:hypothetical protein
MRIERYRKTRYWAVLDAAGTLVCLCVYRKGAVEVVRRLQTLDAQAWQDTNGPAAALESAMAKCPLSNP